MYYGPNLNVREFFVVYYHPQISELCPILITFLILK